MAGIRHHLRCLIGSHEVSITLEVYYILALSASQTHHPAAAF